MNLYDQIDMECIIACETAVSDSMKAHDMFVISVMENAKELKKRVEYGAITENAYANGVYDELYKVK